MATQDAGTESLSPAVTRAAAILDLLAEDGAGPLGPSELGRRLGVAKSSVANICAALATAGLLRREGTGYVLGQRLAELGSAYLAGVDEIKVFREVCTEFLPSHEETVQMATLGRGMDVAYLARRDGSRKVRLMSHIGRHLPANCTATGKALLASCAREDLDRRFAAVPRLEALTTRSITDVNDLVVELDKVRSRGWAIDDEETAEGVLCLAAVVPDATGPPSYAVSFTMLRTHATPERQESLAAQLMQVTSTIGKRLGRSATDPWSA